MSAASDRGRKFEQKVARLMRSKGYKVSRDKRSGAGDVNKADIADWTRSSRLSPELKSQKTLKIREWTRQAHAAAPAGSVPTVVYEDDEQVMAVVPFADLLDLELEAKQYRQQLEELRSTAVTVHTEDIPGLSSAVAKKIRQHGPTCRYGHLADDYGYCQIKGCPGQRGFKASKKA